LKEKLNMAKEKILVIEDEIIERENICFILNKEGYDPIGAENGKIGIEMALKEKPDLILCDIYMPEKDGFEVIIALKKDEKTRDIPFIFLTVYNKPKDIEKGFALGACDYICKPFIIQELLSRVDIHLSLKNKT